MPPLAITARELRRLVAIVADSIAEVVADAAGEESTRLAA
jgi:adenosylmethionine-8-amino-7-oxononanoate aminotransferase